MSTREHSERKTLVAALQQRMLTSPEREALPVLRREQARVPEGFARWWREYSQRGQESNE